MPPLDSNLNKNQLAVDFLVQIIKHFAVRRTHCPAYAGSINAKTNITMATNNNAAKVAATNESANAANAASVESAAEKVKVTINGVTVFDNDGKASVRLAFNESIKGYKADGSEFAETDVNYIDINRAALTKQLTAVNDLIADYRATRTEAFGQREMALILRGAVLTMIRTHHVGGELTGRQDEKGNDIAYQRDCYTSEITAVKLTANAIAKLERATEL